MRLLLGALLLPSLLGAPGAVLAGCVREGRYAMGTVLQVQLCGADDAALRGLAGEVFEAVAREESLFSSHRPDSEVERLCRRAGAGPVAVSAELHRLLAQAKRYAALTRGTFDVTVGPLVRLWKEAGRLPSPEQIARARAETGFDNVLIGSDGRVELTRPGMSIDLGGIAKGYALDRSWERLGGRAGPSTGERQDRALRHPVGSALLEFGRSSVLAIGAPPGELAWNLILRAPDGEALGLLALRDQALSVSASFGQVQRIEGRAFGHVVDPRSGRPVDRELVAAVVAGDATQAEALSKALLILADEGVALVEDLPGAEAILFEPGRRARRTRGWDATVSATRFDAGEATPRPAAETG